MKALSTFFLTSCFIFNLSSCTKKQPVKTVRIDGSSTVFPITEAVAEEFGKVHPRIRVTVGVSGTGGGFKKFNTGETDINNASRRIKDGEITLAKKNKISYVELPIAYDGLSIVVNPKNKWVKELTVAQLKTIWSRGSKIKNWNDIDPSYPNKRLKLYAPGTDSGTFDYFKSTIIGKEIGVRSDFQKSEDDNFLVQGVAGDEGSLGFFGYAYYAENKKMIRAVPIRGPGMSQAVAPTLETIKNGTYKPLSRPIFIYANTHAAKKPEVQSFIKFYLEQAPELVKEVGYVPLENYSSILSRFKNAL